MNYEVRTKLGVISLGERGDCLSLGIGGKVEKNKRGFKDPLEERPATKPPTYFSGRCALRGTTHTGGRCGPW